MLIEESDLIVAILYIKEHPKHFMFLSIQMVLWLQTKLQLTNNFDLSDILYKPDKRKTSKINFYGYEIST